VNLSRYVPSLGSNCDFKVTLSSLWGVHCELDRPSQSPARHWGDVDALCVIGFGCEWGSRLESRNVGIKGCTYARLNAQCEKTYRRWAIVMNCDWMGSNLPRREFSRETRSNRTWVKSTFYRSCCTQVRKEKWAWDSRLTRNFHRQVPTRSLDRNGEFGGTWAVNSNVETRDLMNRN
jgi:hypothetical protein